MDLDMINNNISDETVTLLNDFMNKTWDLVHKDIQTIHQEEQKTSTTIEPKLRKLLQDTFKRTTDKGTSAKYQSVLRFYFYPQIKKAVAKDKPHFLQQPKKN